MSLIRKPYFIVCSLLYFLVWLGKWDLISLPLIFSNYLADLVCLPIVLTLCLIVVRKLRRDQNIWLSWQLVAFMWIYYSVLFEFVVPNYSNHYISDSYDILAYGLGAMSFVYFQKVQSRKLPPMWINVLLLSTRKSS